jgi:hypothetical protein
VKRALDGEKYFIERRVPPSALQGKIPAKGKKKEWINSNF